MKKKIYSIYIVALLLLSEISFSQQGVSISGNYFQPIYTSYVDYIKELTSLYSDVKLKSYGVGVNTQIYRNKKLSIRLGVSFKGIKLTAMDFLDSLNWDFYSYDYDNIHGPPDSIIITKQLFQRTYYFYDRKIYYINKSYSIGLNVDISYHFGMKKCHEVGGVSNLYFYENYVGFYDSRDLSKLGTELSYYEDRLGNESKKIHYFFEKDIPFRNIFLSAIDLQLYYQYNWNISDNFSLGLRASIGTNLYSDWKQFKKYVWAGFGVNVGFLKNEKVRLNRGKLEED